MDVVYETIHDGICNVWISDIFVSVFNRQLPGDEDGGVKISVFKDFHKVYSFGIRHWSQSQMVDHLGVTAIGFLATAIW